MPISLLLACLWVVAAATVAMLPMRWQYVPGAILLLLSVPLLVLIGRDAGWLWVVPVLLAVLSMYRRPLGAIARQIRRRLAGAAA
jgi:hypothetical protein